MEKEWHGPADAHGGKHRKYVEEMHNELKKHHTPEDRKNAAIDLGCRQLQAMKDDGSTMADIRERLAEVVSSFDVLAAGVAHGVTD